MRNYHECIKTEPGKRIGTAEITDKHISVFDVLSCLGSDMSYDEILNDFPGLTKEDIQACLEYAADQHILTRFMVS